MLHAAEFTGLPTAIGQYQHPVPSSQLGCGLEKLVLKKPSVMAEALFHPSKLQEYTIIRYYKNII